jgi:hypothetical protein
MSAAAVHHPDFEAARQRYCDVIRELEMTAAELEALRTGRERPASAQADDPMSRRPPGSITGPWRGP